MTSTVVGSLWDFQHVISHLTGLPLCLFRREEGQEGDEGPGNPPQPSREKERSHSKSKKTRREHRHAAAPLVPSTAALPPQTVEERQVKDTVLNWNGKSSKRAKEMTSCLNFLSACGGPLNRARPRCFPRFFQTAAVHNPGSRAAV